MGIIRETAAMSDTERMAARNSNSQYLKRFGLTEKSERQAEIAVERARINQLSSLKEGSTTGDAELTDIRVDANGKVYSSAGEAVRGQVSELKDDIDDTNKGLSSFDILKYAGLVISHTETYVKIEPNTKYEIILKSEKDTNLIIRTRKKDKSYSKNYTLDLHANEVKKKYITSDEDEYYFLLGQKGAKEENYFIAFRKFIDIDKMRADIDELISFDLSGLISEVNETKDGLAGCKLSKSNLYVDVVTNFDYGDFTIGKPNNPSEPINTAVTYVGTIYANLIKGMVVKITSTDYDYSIAKVSDNKFGEWKAKGNDTVIEEDDRYVICVKSNSYAPFSTIDKYVKQIFKIKSIYYTLKYVDKYRFNVKEYGAVGDGITNDSNAIQSLLNKANTDGNVCVYLPKGTYYVGTTLLYYPNTEIIMHPEAIILRDEKVSPILTNSPICGDDVPCYSNGYLRINGGTFKGVYPSGNSVYRLIGLQCGKLSELTIENVSFIDACAGNHLIDISGCNNVTIRHNKIMGMHLQQSLRPTTPNGDEGHVASLEMIQLDVGEGLGVGINPPYDLIPTKNVVIEDNEFMANPDNTESVLYRPIGIHMNPYDGYYYENIRINDNSFKDILGRCIGISGVRLAEICRNTFESELPMVDDLIKLSMFMGTLARDSHNINIEDNKATMQSETYNFFAVYTGGSTAKYMSNLRIVQNYAPNLAITLENTKNSYLMLNTVSNVDYSIRCEGIIEDETFDKGSAISNPLYGRKIGALGDSLTYGHTLGTDKVWLAKIAERNEMIAYNYGQNGNPLASTENIQGMVERYTAMVDGLHYITVEGGANDMNVGIPIGTNTDTSIYTFKGAINTLIDGLRAKYPTAHICFMTNWKRGYSGEVTYVEAMKEVCALKGIPCKDNYHTSGIDFTDANQSQYFDLGIVESGSANKHFSEVGNEFISWGIEAFLKSC